MVFRSAVSTLAARAGILRVWTGYQRFRQTIETHEIYPWGHDQLPDGFVGCCECAGKEAGRSRFSAHAATADAQILCDVSRGGGS